jgi:nucleoside-diphosphate-sugar epimerase/lipopolysaccharide/colanic/teichoic acid biosynthesis glycosyltransferase
MTARRRSFRAPRRRFQVLLVPIIAGTGAGLVLRPSIALFIGAAAVTVVALPRRSPLLRGAPVRLAVLGSPATTEALSADLDRAGSAATLVGRIGPAAPDLRDERWLGDLHELRSVLERHEIELLVLCDGVPRMRVFDVLEQSCRDVPVRLCELSAFYENHFKHIPLAGINSAWFQFVLHPRHRLKTPRSKRVLDVVGAASLLIVVGPLILAAAGMIRLDGRRAIYRQVRVGERGRAFTMLKLRTMRHRPDGDTSWTRADDDRVTAIGRFLRRTHIDELPQLVNVLRGEMSLVGPRPEQPQYVARLEQTIPFYSRRHQLRPGLTGWAQVNCSYAGSDMGTVWKLSHDLYYLKNRSFGLDLKILLLTIATPFARNQFAEPEQRPLIFGPQPEQDAAWLPEDRADRFIHDTTEMSSPMPPTKVLITGAAGFIGSHLTEACLDRGWDVTAIDSLTTYYSPSAKVDNARRFAQHDRCTYLEQDLLDLDLPGLVCDVDHVFHLAAQAGVRASWGSSFDTYTQLNVTVLQRLLEAARSAPDLRSFVFASSSSVYGDAERMPTSEDQALRPLSPYGATKALGENLNYIYFRSHDVPTLNLRYFSVYGPRQRPDMAFHRAIEAALKGQEFLLNADGRQTRDFTYVSDVVEGTILAALKGEPGATYNVGGGGNVSMLDVLGLLQEMVGDLRVRRGPAQRGDARNTAADIRRACGELGYRPAWGLERGLLEQVRWHQGRERGAVGAAAPRGRSMTAAASW